MLLAILFLSLCLWPALSQLAEKPSAGLLLAIAGIGATLLVAYSIEAAAVSRKSFSRSQGNEAWLGSLVGAGTAGLIGLVIALGLAERASVDHWGMADDMAFALAVGSLLLLALVVVLFPWLSHEWVRIGHFDSDD